MLEVSLKLLLTAQVRYCVKVKFMVCLVAFPSPIISVSNSTMSNCVNLTINQPYLDEDTNALVEYNVNLSCSDGGTVATNNTTLFSNSSIPVCHNIVNTTDLNGFFNCSNYTVTLNVFR